MPRTGHRVILTPLARRSACAGVLEPAGNRNLTETVQSILDDPEIWCAAPFAAQRQALADALLAELAGEAAVKSVAIRPGPVERPFDLTAALETDVGTLATPLWSHARASIFCDPSVHVANRRQLAPSLAVRSAADRLRRRLNVVFSLESRGLTVRWAPEEGVERTWTAERSFFRGTAAVHKEDRLQQPGELDLRELLARFYTGPALRLVGAGGEAFLLPAASDDADAELISLCRSCHTWQEGAASECARCGARLDVIAATRPALGS